MAKVKAPAMYGKEHLRSMTDKDIEAQPQGAAMISRLTRWRFAGTLLPAAMLVLGTSAFAQEDVINQTNDGQGTYWLPIVSAFLRATRAGIAILARR